MFQFIYLLLLEMVALYIWILSIFFKENAQKIAEFLPSHPRVKKVNYASLPDHPGRSLHYSQVLILGGSLAKGHL